MGFDAIKQIGVASLAVVAQAAQGAAQAVAVFMEPSVRAAREVEETTAQRVVSDGNTN